VSPVPRASAVALGKMVAAGACWGLAAVFAKLAFDRGVAPVRMAEARVVVAVVVLAVALALWRPALLRPPPGRWPALVAFGLSVAAVNGSYYVAIDRVPVGVALSLQYTAPVLLLGLSVLSHRRHPGAVGWLAAVATVAGAVLVSRAYAGFGALDALGLTAALASAVFFAAYLTAADVGGRTGIHPATLLLWGFAVALVAWSVAAPWWTFPWARLAQPNVVWEILGVGLVGTLVPFFLAVGAVPVLSPATAAIVATVEPPFAAAFAWLFLDQRLGAVQLLGGALVLAGVVLAQRMVSLSADALAVEPSA
jgi:drug/metabolite transporter (DMT)-like permease